jgi:heme A synthase
MGTPPNSAPAAKAAPQKKVWEQDWYKWIEVITKIWGLLTLLYAGASKFFAFLPLGKFEGPRTAGIIIFYVVLPIAVLGLYGFCLGIPLWLTGMLTVAVRTKFSVVVSIPLFVVALTYISRSELPGFWFIPPFFLGIGWLWILTSVAYQKIKNKG